MDSKLRKHVLRSLSNGMYVVTTGDREAAAGATVTWLTQSSFEPPLLVACVREGSGLWEGIERNLRAVVHVLGEDQQEIAKRFFTPAELEGATLNGLEFEATPAGPRLRDARAWAECKVRELIDCGGDHRLVVLQVLDVGAEGDIEPLTVRASPWQYGG